MRRMILVALASLASGALIGRSVVNRAVERRVAAEIERAKVMAMAELDKTVEQMLRERLWGFLLTGLAKAAVIGAVYGGYLAGVFDGDALHLLALTVVGLFLLRDLVITLPFLPPAIRFARRHGWRLRLAVSEFVAAQVFERAYARALLAAQSGGGRFWIAVSKYTAQSISAEVASAVADLARRASFRRIWPRVAVALAKAAAFSLLYLLFLAATLGRS